MILSLVRSAFVKCWAQRPCFAFDSKGKKLPLPVHSAGVTGSLTEPRTENEPFSKQEFAPSRVVGLRHVRVSQSALLPVPWHPSTNVADGRDVVQVVFPICSGPQTKNWPK